MTKAAKPNRFFKEILSFFKIFVIALLITIPIKYFLLEPFMVSGASMHPSFETGHYLVVNKLKKYEKINRGDVLVFVPPHERKKDSWKKYTVFLDPRKKYIKRVIALPGETIATSNNKIFIKHKDGNGKEVWITLNEPYLKNTEISNFTKTLKNDEYFMLGDNRPFSYDSEEWGPIKKSDITGEPILRLFPFTKIGFYPENEEE